MSKPISKSQKELAKESAKAEKLAKFREKQEKLQQNHQTTKLTAVSNGISKRQAKEAKVKEASSAHYVEETPKGEKKILKPLDDEFHKAYIPGVVESAWYDWWEASGFMKPEFNVDGKVKPQGAFVIAIPPPNVTGALHAGHALATSLQDTLIRWHRMRGFTTLFIPGCDHASISTQSVIENMLWRRQGKTRHDLGRPKFLEITHDWKEEYHQKINRVLRRLGASLDWTREAFTMSPHFARAVNETFISLEEEGLIYRANRLVNWCTRLTTAISNLEVDYKEVSGRTLLDVPGYDKKVEFGVITHFRYPIDGTEDQFLEVATTRPETMLGDTGIAVHPDDSRYKHLIGMKVRHPFIPNRILPIIADAYVDREFGTGAVKLTPAHDPNDFDLGKKHGLEFINILSDDGTLNENAGPFQGQKRFDARYNVVAALEEKGLFVKKADNAMTIPLCTKSKDVIEPLMKPQWWMKMKDMAAAALNVVDKGEISIQPQSAQKNYRSWMSNVNDWCLSRQLWWGHQIPAYLIKFQNLTATEHENPKSDEIWITARSEEEARTKAVTRFPNQFFTLERDPDVLDTWFSAGLWPFATLGWPDQTHDLEHLYPTNVLETGWDILFPWVARMIMLGLKLMGKVPFTEVYCHSLIRDSEGRKMSKSLGNVIDPIDILEGIELQSLHEKLRIGNLDPKEVQAAERYQKTAFPNGIPECGADALRFSLVQYTTGGGDIAFDVKVMAAYRRFCNKIYQATKFVLGKLPSEFIPNKVVKPSGNESLAEKWILHKYSTASRDINRALSDREFSRSTQIVYAYFYYHLCDVFIENAKSILQHGTAKEKESALQTLYTTIEGGLKMIHPFMPFLSEELWQRLPRRPGDETPSIMVASYPDYLEVMDDDKVEAAYEIVLSASSGIRSLFADYGINEGGHAWVQALDQQAYETATAQKSAIRSLIGRRLTDLEVIDVSSPRPSGCAVYSVSSQIRIWILVKRMIDTEKELPKAQVKLDQAREDVRALQKSLENARKGGASSAAIAQDEKRLINSEARVSALEDAVSQFTELKLEG